MPSKPKKKSKRGRKTKLTLELTEIICESLEAGNYVKTACLAAGISEETYYKWIKRGEEAKRKNKFSEFLESIKEAKAKGEERHVYLISKAGERYWQASAYLLERMYPDRWGKQTKMEMEHSGEVKQEHKGKVDIEITPIDEFNRIMDESLDNLETEDTTPKE
jgi:transposase-like protein